jgi:short-subunit dehydrogenase
MVNVASIAGTLPMSYYNVYSASKAYVDRLSLSLNYEHP